MRLYLKQANSNVNATAEYDEKSKIFTVLKGSTVSETISHSEKFRGANSIERARRNIVEKNIVTKSVQFSSASTAANFVTGSSTNGLKAWKNAKGETLKKILTKKDAKDE